LACWYDPPRTRAPPPKMTQLAAVVKVGKELVDVMIPPPLPRPSGTVTGWHRQPITLQAEYIGPARRSLRCDL
jgi:hypothetical protein